jgi:hypothetical protein
MPGGAGKVAAGADDGAGPCFLPPRPRWLRAARVVPPTGFEPVISTLKGWRPRPLDDGGPGAAESSREPRPGHRVAGRARAAPSAPPEEREDGSRGERAEGDERREAACDGGEDGAPAGTVAPCPIGPVGAHDREGGEDDAEDRRPGGEERDLVRVADRDRVGEVAGRPDEGDDDEDARRREAKGADVRAGARLPPVPVAPARRDLAAWVVSLVVALALGAAHPRPPPDAPCADGRGRPAFTTGEGPSPPRFRW